MACVFVGLVLAACAEASNEVDQKGAAGATGTAPASDGEIAFTLFTGSGQDIYTVNPDGLDEQWLTDKDAIDQDTAWSPDGALIAFTSFLRPPLEGQGPGIFLMDASDGSNVHLLVANGFGPWSPDGTRILFPREAIGGVDVYTINVDGSVGLTQLTGDDTRDVSATW